METPVERDNPPDMSANTTEMVPSQIQAMMQSIKRVKDVVLMNTRCVYSLLTLMCRLIIVIIIVYFCLFKRVPTQCTRSRTIIYIQLTCEVDDINVIFQPSLLYIHYTYVDTGTVSGTPCIVYSEPFFLPF